MEIFKEFRFEAAHFLPLVTDGHKCRSLHGHSYRCEIRVRGSVADKGWVCDFADIKSAVDPVVRRLDHRCLNDIVGLSNPTSENLAIWIWRQVQTALPGICRVTVSETESSGCVYEGDEAATSGDRRAVYLAGGINGLTDAACRDWREYAKSKIPNCLDPMRRDYRGREDQHEIVTGDYADIRACHAVIANCVTPSWGTAMEIHFAWSIGRTVHAVIPLGNRASPWLRYHCTAIHETLDAAIAAVQEIL